MTRIKWKKDVELKIHQHDNTDITYIENFKKGEKDDVRVDMDNGKTVRMIFACGDVSFEIKKSLFQIEK